jgi:acyl-CoA reductase-like NAD-dependent aldehyde dehydrogenase
MKIVQKVIFGSEVSIMPFKDIDDALKLAHDSVYGLAANVWTKNINKAHKMAAGLEAGSVWINCHGIIEAAAPSVASNNSVGAVKYQQKVSTPTRKPKSSAHCWADPQFWLLCSRMTTFIEARSL